MSYEADFELLSLGEAQGGRKPGDFEKDYLYKMAEEPFAAANNYEKKNTIYFKWIRVHPQANDDDHRIINCREGDLMRRNGDAVGGIGKLLPLWQQLPTEPQANIAGNIGQALAQAYYHNSQLAEAMRVQEQMCSASWFGGLPAFKRFLLVESLFTFLMDMNYLEKAASAIKQAFGLLLDPGIEPNQIPRVFGGLFHIWGDLEYKRERYLVAANLYYAVHATFNPDPRNMIVGAMKFLQCLWLAEATDDLRFTPVKEFFLLNHSKMEATDKVGHKAAWDFVSQKLGLTEN